MYIFFVLSNFLVKNEIIVFNKIKKCIPKSEWMEKMKKSKKRNLI